jgi:hypothetical protein
MGFLGKVADANPQEWRLQGLSFDILNDRLIYRPAASD